MRNAKRKDAAAKLQLDGPDKRFSSDDHDNTPRPKVKFVWRSPMAPQHRTDLGNARRLIESHGHTLRFCEPLGGWLVWSGKRWTADDTGAVVRKAKATITALYQDAAHVEDSNERKAIAKWAMRSESQARLRAMLALAETEADVVARPEAFDADPWLLNVENGTLDLRTGELSEHQRDDLITKLAPVEYHPEATDKVLDNYLADTTAGDPDFAAYLQRAAGYTLTGVTDEEALFLVLGPAATGKSTLVEAMLAMLGDYGVKAGFDTFLVQRNVGGPRPDIVRLRGARLAAAVESPRGRWLDETVVKELTGGDTVAARDLYQPPFEFSPSFKLWLAANESPRLSDDDSGIWRRLKRLPFEHEIVKQDPAVKRHLCSPEGGRALLAWAVTGCLTWQEDGLGTCDVVRKRTLELRADMNPIAEFLDMRCVVTPEAETPARDLRTAYENWARAFGAHPINNRQWGRRLRALGCKSRRKRVETGRIAVWHGIGLLE